MHYLSSHSIVHLFVFLSGMAALNTLLWVFSAATNDSAALTDIKQVLLQNKNKRSQGLVFQRTFIMYGN